MNKPFEQILQDIVKNNYNHNLLDAATYSDISMFEQVNNIRLPRDYTKFLYLADGADLYLPAGVQLFGVSHKPTIDILCEDRPNDEYIVIGYLSNGDPVLFKKDNKEISIYNIKDNTIEDDETYKDFSSFLADLENILGLE